MSLGHLSQLPLELREAIYEFTVGSLEREVDVYSKCAPRSILSLVSRRLEEEVKAVVTRKKTWPCKHTDFTFTLWDPREDIEDAKRRLGFGGEQGMRRTKGSRHEQHQTSSHCLQQQWN